METYIEFRHIATKHRLKNVFNDIQTGEGMGEGGRKRGEKSLRLVRTRLDTWLCVYAVYGCIDG